MPNGKLLFNLPVVITKQNKRFVELANLFLEEIISAGTANDVLSELGWKKAQKKWSPPKIISSQSIGLSMPVSV